MMKHQRNIPCVLFNIGLYYSSRHIITHLPGDQVNNSRFIGKDVIGTWFWMCFAKYQAYEIYIILTRDLFLFDNTQTLSVGSCIVLMNCVSYRKGVKFNCCELIGNRRKWWSEEDRKVNVIIEKWIIVYVHWLGLLSVLKQ